MSACVSSKIDNCVAASHATSNRFIAYSLRQFVVRERGLGAAGKFFGIFIADGGSVAEPAPSKDCFGL